MQRVVLNRSNPSQRLTSIAAASARRQAAAVPIIVDAAVGEVSGELSALANATAAALNNLEARVHELENPI